MAALLSASSARLWRRLRRLQVAFDDLDHEGGRLAWIALLGQQMRDDLVDRPDEGAGGKGMERPLAAVAGPD